MFPGVVLRKTSRKFDGLNPEAVRAYYNSHISNNIGITVLGVYFEDSLENAGRSIYLFQRSRSAKVIHRNLVWYQWCYYLK